MGTSSCLWLKNWAWDTGKQPPGGLAGYNWETLGLLGALCYHCTGNSHTSPSRTSKTCQSEPGCLVIFWLSFRYVSPLRGHDPGAEQPARCSGSTSRSLQLLPSGAGGEGGSVGFPELLHGLEPVPVSLHPPAPFLGPVTSRCWFLTQPRPFPGLCSSSC